MGKGAEGSMESRAEGRERGTEGELKCLGRAWQCLWSWLDHGSWEVPKGHCGNLGCDRGVFGRKIWKPYTMYREPGSPHRPKAIWACSKPIRKDGLPCQNLYICNQGRNQSRQPVAIACFAIDCKSLSRLGLGIPALSWPWLGLVFALLFRPAWKHSVRILYTLWKSFSILETSIRDTMESLIKNIESIVGMFLISCLAALPVWGVVYQEARKRGLESKWILYKNSWVLSWPRVPKSDL